MFLHLQGHVLVPLAIMHHGLYARLTSLTKQKLGFTNFLKKSVVTVTPRAILVHWLKRALPSNGSDAGQMRPYAPLMRHGC